MRRLTEDEIEENDEKTDTWDMLAWIVIVMLVGGSLGYFYRFIQEPSAYERGYIQGIDELSVVTRGEICK